jgi:virginiamycin B lyase
VDAQGRVWFTDRVAGLIGRFDPERLSFESFRPPTARSGPYGLLLAPDGVLWYAGSNAGILGRLDPRTGEILEYRVGQRGGPQLIALSGSTIWFTMRDAYAFGRFDTRTGVVRVFQAPERRTPYGVATAPDGTVWMSTMRSYQLLRIDPRTDSVTTIDLSGPAPESLLQRFRGRPDSARLALSARRRGEARRIAVGPDGEVWIGDHQRGLLLRYEPDSGTVREFQSLNGTRVYGVGVAPSGEVWYNEPEAAAVMLLDPETGETQRVRLPTAAAAVRHIAFDRRRGRVWLPVSDSGRIARIDWR